jgi:hypothetical protein
MRIFVFSALLFVACARAGEGSNPYGTGGGVGGTSGVTANTSSTGSGSCNGGLVACGGMCVDTTADANHCGTCDNACPEGFGCDGGQCSSSATTNTSASSVGVSASSVGVSASSVGVSASSVGVATSAAASSSSSGGGGGNCDPMFPAPGCGSGKHCQPTQTGIPSCVGPIGVSGQYGFCGSSADCSAAYECVTTPYSTVYCLQWCKTDADCGGLDYCNTLNPPVYVGATEYGVCYDGYP